jgi:hypothetical protein
MRKFAFITIALCLAASAQDRPATRHLLGVERPLTAPSSRPVRDIAREYTAQAAAQIGVGPADLGSLYIAKEYTDDHNRVTHIVYRQQFQGIDVFNAAWVVNIDSQGQVLNAGGDLFGAPLDALPSSASAIAAARAAVKAVNPKLAAGFQPFRSQKQPSRQGSIRFAQGNLPEDVEGEMVWYAVRGALRPAWVFYVTDEDGASRYATIVDDASQLPLEKRPMTHFQNANAKGMVFDRDSPNPSSTPGKLLTEAPPMVDRVMKPFTGDPIASPRGWVSGTETAGNNVIAGENLLGTRFLATPTTAKAADGNFTFPLMLGAGNPSTIAFPDAVTTNLFYWMNRAHDLHYASGFTEAAGNFQTDNLGHAGVGGDPMYVYSHFGAQSPARAQTQNAYFSQMRVGDGAQGMVAMFVGFSGRGGFYTDGALDSQIMLHEYTHGVSERLLPNGYDSFQIAAMGEAWSDFYSLEYTLPDGAPADGAYGAAEYMFWAWGQGIRTRPYSTDMTVNPLTYGNIGNVILYPEVHADGEIWMEALWEMRANLIRQFGEKEGRRRVRIMVLDGMKLAPPRSSMVDMRDAILLADRVDYDGASQDQIWTAFAKRGLGATAYAGNPDSVHVLASFEKPSARGKIAFYEQLVTIGEPVRVVVNDSNYTAPTMTVQLTGSSGDLETLVLRKQGSIYAGTIATSGNVVTKQNGTINLINGDYISAYYNDANTGSGPAQIQATILSRPGYVATGSAPSFDSGGPDEVQLLSGQRVELPFAFRFYDQSYKALLVDENGLLSFADTLTTGCTDTLALRTTPAIAPFWLGLTTEGIAQPNEGIFYKKIPGAVTFRWAAETFTILGNPGDPVNFAVTLVDDGSIIYNYGSGNRNLQTAATPLGCSPGPTVGISPGHDTFAQTYLLTDFANTTTIRLDPPFNAPSLPVVTVETPKADDHAQDVLTVSGIAYDPVAFMSRVDALIDGVQMGSAAPTLARADFCSQQNVHGCPRVGYSININTASLSPGRHTLKVRATNSRSAFTDGPDEPITINIEAGQGRLPFGKIESPTAGQEVTGSMTIRGYIAANDLRILSVDTLIDGISYGPTSYNLTRNDICGTLSPRPVNCPGIGFQYVFNTKSGTPPLQDGPHTIQIRAQDETGRYTLVPDATVKFTVKNGAYNAPAGAIDSPKNGQTVSGTATFSGHAYATDAGRVTNVLVIFDNNFAVTARYGVASPDACATLPNVAACPNIGWTLDYDTTKLPNGPHVVMVQVTGTGGTVLLPSVGQPTISFNVRN